MIIKGIRAVAKTIEEGEGRIDLKNIGIIFWW
jgi:hypothetical protein